MAQGWPSPELLRLIEPPEPLEELCLEPRLWPAGLFGGGGMAARRIRSEISGRPRRKHYVGGFISGEERKKLRAKGKENNFYML